MAATIATAIGRDQRRGTNVERECTRLGAAQSEGKAATFKTFATAIVNADGSGFVKVERTIEGKRVIIGRLAFGPETLAEQVNHVGISGYGVVKFPQGISFTIDEPVPVVTEEMLSFDARTNGGAF